MRRLLPLALILAACGPSGQSEPHQADSGAAGPSQSDPQKTTPAPPVQTTGNPNRIHQLKDLKKVDIDVKGNTIHAWVMDDDSKQQEGMMFLTDKDVKADEGMLFAFDKPQLKADERGFWMHNTLIPLDIVYLSPKGQVLNIAHGKIQDDTTLPAAGDFQYVLEVKAGTMAKLGLKAGDTVPIPKW